MKPTDKFLIFPQNIRTVKMIVKNSDLGLNNYDTTVFGLLLLWPSTSPADCHCLPYNKITEHSINITRQTSHFD